MKPLIPTECYVEIKTSERKPIEPCVFAISESFGKSFKYGSDLTDDERWLENKSDMLVISIEELKEIISKTYARGARAADESREHTYFQEKEEYINSLFK